VTYSNAILKRLARLKQKKHREAEHLFLAEGRTLVQEATVPPIHLLTDPAYVKRLSTLTTPTGPIAVFPFLDVTAAEVLEQRDRIVFLHAVQVPGNVGTIIRAAHAFGAGVALSTDTADLYNPKTVRATMGSIFHTPIARRLQGGEHPSSLLAEKLVIVVGAEGGGLPEEVVSACPRAVTIPALAASLNAAVAASILLYEAYNRVLP
jgi:TrmH family RNA methyltransferase